VFSDHCRAQMVKDNSILDPLSPARTKILQGNRSRGAGRDLKWQESVATCKLTLRRLILTLSLTAAYDWSLWGRMGGAVSDIPLGEDNSPPEIKSDFEEKAAILNCGRNSREILYRPLPYYLLRFQ
jgi:hypothetical protein